MFQQCPSGQTHCSASYFGESSTDLLTSIYTCHRLAHSEATPESLLHGWITGHGHDARLLKPATRCSSFGQWARSTNSVAAIAAFIAAHRSLISVMRCLCAGDLSVVSPNTDRGGAGITSAVLRRQSVEAHGKTPYELLATRARLLEARTAGRAPNLSAIPNKHAAHLISSGRNSGQQLSYQGSGFVASSHTPHGASIARTHSDPCSSRTIHMGSFLFLRAATRSLPPH